ncbi:MAG: heterodisulfide reductase-related iron-sulfur binding cluster, partial [Promethearchaeota archaeon]
MIDTKDKKGKINQERLGKVPEITESIYYFEGCTERVYPGIINSFLDLCDALGIDVSTSNKQSCCSGNFLPFNVASVKQVGAITQRNLNVIAEYSKNCITTCNGCFSSFNNVEAYLSENSEVKEGVIEILDEIGKKFVDDVNVFHVVEFLYKNRKELKKVLKNSLSGMKVSVHYGCHFLHQEDPSKIIDDVEAPHIMEAILKDLGAEVIPYKERALCCGAGLNQRILHEDRINSLNITLRKMKSIRNAAPDFVVVVCPYCEFHLDNAQVELDVEFDEEFEIPVLHLT